MKERRIDTRKRFLFIAMILAVILIVPVPAKKSEAATYCETAICYPIYTKTAVHLRSGAGTGFKSLGVVPAKQRMWMLGYCYNNGAIWCKCATTMGGKTVTGYSMAYYLGAESSANGYVNARVKKCLYMRSACNYTSSITGTLSPGYTVTIIRVGVVGGQYWYGLKAVINNKVVYGYVPSLYINTVLSSTSVSASTAANTTTTTTSTATKSTYNAYVNNKVTTYLNVRQYASTSSKVLATIPRGTQINVLGVTGSWCRVYLVYNGRQIVGYVSSQYVSLNNTQTTNTTANNTNKTTTTTTTTNTVMTDATFEALLANFPASYKTKLRELHQKYPKWKFVPVNTGLDWNTVIDKESLSGKNVIQSNYPNGGNSLAPYSYLATGQGSYNWASDKYIVKDGTNWYTANSSVIAYYMDPRNFLNDTDIFQFEALAYDSSHSSSVVQNILNNTFMKSTYYVKDRLSGQIVTGSYTQAFMDAGVSSKASPYFLASRVKQEVGVNGSGSTSGNYGAYYGIYNFYNIGAFDGGDAVAKGLLWAAGGASGATSYGRPWTTPYKSIVGGASYIAQNYISKGQNTLYFQKFNTHPNDAGQLYVHQYMTNVQAPYNEGRTTRNSYKNLGIMGEAMIFYIPVYNNMPASACALPAVSGNPNPYIYMTDLYYGQTKITGLTPTFRYDRFEYTVVVPAGVSNVTVKATSVSSKASISGNNLTYTLKGPGQTTDIVITGVAQNGTKQNYTFHVTRAAQ